MSESLIFIVVLLKQYLVPFFYAVGIAFFIHGFINYFILGPGDESRADSGRNTFLQSCSFFSIGLVLFALASFLAWTLAFNAGLGNDSNQNGSGSVGTPVQRTEGILSVPNTPQIGGSRTEE